MDQKSLVSIIVKNTPGVLADISKVMGDCKLNIEKLVASYIDIGGEFTKIMFYITGDRKLVNDILEKNIRPLPTVQAILNFSSDDKYIEREVCLIKIANSNPEMNNLQNVIETFDGRMTFINEEVAIYQFIDDTDRIDDLVKKLCLFTKQIEISRTGVIATTLINDIKSVDFFSENK